MVSTEQSGFISPTTQVFDFVGAFSGGFWEKLRVPKQLKPILTDKQWAKIEPLLPQRPSKGRPWADNRRVLEGILWVLKTGARWRDLPPQYPSASTCWRRLRLWEEDETWLRVWRQFLSELDRKGKLDWSESFLDGSFAPAKKGAPASEKPSGARARSGWWWSTAKVFLWEANWSRPARGK